MFPWTWGCWCLVGGLIPVRIILGIWYLHTDKKLILIIHISVCVTLASLLVIDVWSLHKPMMFNRVWNTKRRQRCCHVCFADGSEERSHGSAAARIQQSVHATHRFSSSNYKNWDSVFACFLKCLRPPTQTRDWSDLWWCDIKLVVVDP